MVDLLVDKFVGTLVDPLEDYFGRTVGNPIGTHNNRLIFRHISRNIGGRVGSPFGRHTGRPIGTYTGRPGGPIGISIVGAIVGAINKPNSGPIGWLH